MRCTWPRRSTSSSLELSDPSSPCWLFTSRSSVVIQVYRYNLSTHRVWAWMQLNAVSWSGWGRSSSTLPPPSGTESLTGSFSSYLLTFSFPDRSLLTSISIITIGNPHSNPKQDREHHQKCFNQVPSWQGVDAARHYQLGRLHPPHRLHPPPCGQVFLLKHAEILFHYPLLYPGAFTFDNNNHPQLSLQL